MLANLADRTERYPMRFGFLLVFFVFSFLVGGPESARGQGELPRMKFDEVREIAPGVFFRYASISAVDKDVVFGGCNNIWVVFDDYVLVFDANFPKEAGDVIAAVKKTTDKPIRYVLDSHHHGDHAYGNSLLPASTVLIGHEHMREGLRVDPVIDGCPPLWQPALAGWR